MKDILTLVKLAFSDTNSYLNRLKLIHWIPFFLSFVFLGWNGIQIIFSTNLILSFVNTRSITFLVYNTIEYHLRSVPIYLFILLTLIVIHWMIHSLFEIGITRIVHKENKNWKQIINIGINFFVPNLIIVIAIFFTVITLLMLSIFLQIALSGFRTTAFANMQNLLYQVFGLAVFLSIGVTMWLTDFVLPWMALGATFKQSLLKAINLLNNQPFSIAAFFLIKILLIVLSVYIFQLALRHLLLPLFIMLETKYTFSLFLISARKLVFNNLLINLRILFLVLFSALLVYAPIIAPLYLFQRFYLLRLTKK